jgi:hypothetical protein
VKLLYNSGGDARDTEKGRKGLEQRIKQKQVRSEETRGGGTPRMGRMGRLKAIGMSIKIDWVFFLALAGCST